MGFAALVVLAVLVLIVQGQGSSGIFKRRFMNLHQAASISSRASTDTLYVKQKVDNFNEKDNRTWTMRYMFNTEFYKSGGPIFIFVGGNYEVLLFNTHDHLMYNMAQEHNGALFYTEHRYYGENRPTSDLSLSNLQYLNVRQALADLAHLIRTLKATLEGASESKVILLGESYSAGMVTWFKKLYPELATGCWASSAPLLAKVDFFEYAELVGKSIRKLGGETCYQRIENGIAALEKLFETKEGAQQAKTLLNLCKTFDENNKLDIWMLFGRIFGKFSGVVEYHNDNNIQKNCKLILEGKDDLGGLVAFFMAKFNASDCNDLSYKTFITEFKETKYDDDNTDRQWLYQTCNEFGWFSTSTSKTQPFGTKFPLEFHISMCVDAFGPEFTHESLQARINETNQILGGLYPKVENVYMTQGELDPWRALDTQNVCGSTILPFYSHCQDSDPIRKEDTPEMRASKEKILALVRTWVGKV